MGIEPTLSAWEAEVLPLNYTRAEPLKDNTTCFQRGILAFTPMGGGRAMSHTRAIA